MKILVVAATQQEIAPFVRLHNNIEVLICGVGIPSTVYHLTKKLLNENYDLVIQTGIAGKFSKKIKKGEVVAVEQDAFADIGAEENGEFKTIFQLGFGDENKFPFKKGWLVNTSEVLQTSHLKKVKAVTINRIRERKKQTMQLKEIFNADIESMEGAAFHFVCLQQNIPFLQIRSISNKVGERDKTKWKIKEAIENLNLELKNLVELLNG
jgi:futalosine hydrolase